MRSRKDSSTLESPIIADAAHTRKAALSAHPCIRTKSSSVQAADVVGYSGDTFQMSIQPPTSGPVLEKITWLLLAAKFREALTAARVASKKFPRDAEVATHLADALYANANLRDAEKHYRRAIELNPAIFQAHYGLGIIHLSHQAFAAAARSLQHALKLKPDDPGSLLALGSCCFAVGEVDVAIDHYERIASQPQIAADTRTKALLEIGKIIPGSPKRSNAAIKQAREAWAAAQTDKNLHTAAKPKPPRSTKTPAAPPPKLRVAYLSAYFGSRNWMKPVWGVINEHDRAAFELHLLHDDKPPSPASGYRRHRADHLHDVTALDDDRASALIQKLGIDVLIDLNGYSYTRRLNLLLRKPAPAQLGWFNMYATTGMPQFDAIVGDAHVIPNEEAAFYAEKILRVSGTYLAFNVQYRTPDVVAPPCLTAPNRALTFGCLAPQCKITPEVLVAWSQILAASPQVRLVLQNTYLRDEENRADVLARFAKLGIAPERLVLHPPAEHLAFLKTYAEIDVALDTFPHSGGTTTMESLWQGVPVLTFEGDRWAARTTKSLLLAARLDDWVVRSRDAYVKRAIDLARSERTPAMLAALRREMRWGLMESAACDTSRLCRELEAIYKKIARQPTTARRP
jgi:protein O-GlcNAc transferase